MVSHTNDGSAESPAREGKTAVPSHLLICIGRYWRTGSQGSAASSTFIQLLLLSQSSTVQILGAEKALFRALKTRGNTPKYGLIFHSTFIGRAKQRNKGRISRYLANKCSIASRIDCFMDVATSAFGERMKEQVRLRSSHIC
jgi:hypothetical protein